MRRHCRFRLCRCCSSIAATTYVGAKSGWGVFDSACVDSVNCEDDSVAGGLYGGYNFTDNIALELNADYLGDYDKLVLITTGQLSATAIPLVAISLSPMYRDWRQIKKEFDVFFKAGPAKPSCRRQKMWWQVVLALASVLRNSFQTTGQRRVEYQYFDVILTIRLSKI